MIFFVYAIKNGRDATPNELHLHVHTHGHDGKTFVGDRSRDIHVSLKLGGVSVLSFYSLW